MSAQATLNGRTYQCEWECGGLRASQTGLARSLKITRIKLRCISSTTTSAESTRRCVSLQRWKPDSLITYGHSKNCAAYYLKQSRVYELTRHLLQKHLNGWMRGSMAKTNQVSIPYLHPTVHHV